MKIKVRAKVTVEVEKKIEAPSMEDALARARKMGFDDFLYVAHGTVYWENRVKVEVKGVAEAGRR